MRRAGAPSPQQRFYKSDPTDQRTCSYYLRPRYILWMIGPVFILGLFVWGTWTISWSYLILTLAETSSLAYLWLLLFNGPMILSTISLFKTTFSDPGSVPRGFDEDVVLRERTPKGEMRFCKVCNNLKPDRAHHCSMSGQCVLKMDHFCPWVGNTIGFRNYKFFLLFLFYTVITCWMGFFVSLGPSIGYMNSLEITGAQINHIVSAFVSAMFAVVLSIFLGQHIHITLQNLTTLESMDSGRVKQNAYNIGARRNWRQVFGDDKFMWFVPVITAIGDGIEWEINVDETQLGPLPPVRGGGSTDEDRRPVDLDSHHRMQPTSQHMHQDYPVPLDSMESMESMEMTDRGGRGDHMV